MLSGPRSPCWESLQALRHELAPGWSKMTSCTCLLLSGVLACHHPTGEPRLALPKQAKCWEKREVQEGPLRPRVRILRSQLQGAVGQS